MNAFVAAARALAADRNLSVEALYRERGFGPGQALRVIVSTPDEANPVFGAPLRVGVIDLDVLVADVTEIRQSDTFEFDDGRQVAVIAARRNAEGTNWSVSCRNV